MSTRAKAWLKLRLLLSFSILVATAAIQVGAKDEADYYVSLTQWRDEAARVQKLVENDFYQAYAEARQLADTLPVDAPASDHIKSLNLLSRVESYLGMIEPAGAHAREAMALARQHNDRIGRVEAYLNMGINAIYQADMDTVVSAPIEALPLLEHADKPHLLAETMLQAAMMYIRLKRLEDTFSIAMDAMAIARRQSDPLVLAYAHQGLGAAYMQNHRWAQALEHLQLMLQNARAAQSKRLEASALAAIGSTYTSLGDYARAERHIRESIALFRELGGPFYLAHALFALADNFQAQNRYDEALVVFDDVVEILERNPNPLGQWWAYSARGQLRQKTAHNDAAADLEEAYRLAQEIGLPLYLSQSLNALAERDAAEGNYEQAYRRIKESEDIAEAAARAKTSERTAEVAQRIMQQQHQRQLEQLEQRNREQMLELESQKLKQESTYQLLAVSLLGLVIAIALFLRLRQSHRLLQHTNSQLMLNSQVFEQSAEGIVIFDANREIISVNRAFCEMAGYEEDELEGHYPGIFGSAYHDRSSSLEMWKELEANGSWQGEIWTQRKNGERYPVRLSISVVHNRMGEPRNYIAIGSDISQHKQAEEHIHHLSYYDALTGLPNRSMINDRIEQAIAYAQRAGQSIALMFLDLDRFQNINDSLGHRVGDAVLVETASRLSKMISAEYTLSRLGGDDFILLVTDGKSDRVANVARKVGQCLAAPFYIDNHELAVTASIGISIYPEDGGSREALIQSADSAMNQAKKDGRNTFCFFTNDMYLHTSRILKLESALHGALARNELLLYYQPQVDVRKGRIVGCEALLRWQHPEFGMVSPAEFIPIAEESGQILSIGEWVLQTAVRQVKAWESEGLPLLSVAVNLSAVQFRQATLLDTIIRVLDENKLAPEYLELELTESTAMEKPADAIATISSLHDAGVRIAIDDFGTGYSSLSYLKRLKIHKLKIDQSFIKDISVDADDGEIVRTVIALAKSFKLHTIAEGVETREQLAILQAEGCDELQGYLFSEPLPAHDFAGLFRRNRSLCDVIDGPVAI